MKEIILLTKVLFKSSSTQVNNKKSKNIGKIILLILVYFYLSGIVAYISFEAISSLILIRQEAVFLNLCFISILGILSVQTIVTSLNIMFFSKDLEYLLPLPIKSEKIVMSKINCMIILQYIMLFIIIFPALIMYGILLNLSIEFYIVAFFIILLFPIIPILFITFLITIIMKFTRAIKNKDIIQYITVLLTIVMIIVIQFISGMNQEITKEELANKLVEANGLVKAYSNVFFTLKLTMNIILNYNNIIGIFNLMLLFILTLTFYVIIAKLISLVYIKYVISNQTQRVCNVRRVNFNKYFKEQSNLISYVKKEFKLLNRNPIFFMQCVLPSVLMPIIVLIPVVMSLKDIDSNTLLELQNEFLSYSNTSIEFIIIIIVVLFFFAFNFCSITAISRDKDDIIIMKYLPLELEKQFFYKILPGILLNLVPIVFFVVISKIVINIISWKMIILTSGALILINIFNNYIMLLIDLKNPKLNWISEYTVVKQNMNMLFEILIVLLQAGLIFTLGYNISNLNILAIILTIIYISLIYIVRRYVRKNVSKLFEKIGY